MRRPLLIPMICFLAGILTANLSGISIVSNYVSIAVLIIAIVILLISAIKCSKLFPVILCAAFFLLGIFRYTGSMSPLENDIRNFAEQDFKEVVIAGTVAGDPEWKGSFAFRHLVFPFRVKRLLADKEEHLVTGIVLVKLFGAQEKPLIGDDLVVTGRMSVPPGMRNPAGFDYSRYLKYKGISAVISSVGRKQYMKIGTEKGLMFLLRRQLFSWRYSADEVVHKYLFGDTRAVVESIVLGLRNGITEDMSDIFVKTGTMHILAVSGLHVGLVGVVFLMILRLARCPEKLRYVLTMGGICAFAVFAGARSSSIRAALMGVFVLLNLMFERKTDMSSALALSAFLIIYFCPGQLFGPGFIFSYTAVLSIIYVVPLTDAFFGVELQRFNEDKIYAIKRKLLKTLSVSFAVWIGMMPLSAVYFHIITPVVVLTNFLAIPMLFVTIILSLVLLAMGGVPVLGILTGYIAGVLTSIVHVFIAVMRFISQIPYLSMRTSSPGVIAVVAYYVILVLAIWSFHARNRHKKLVPIVLMFAANLFVWNEYFHGPPDTTRVTFFDTGKSDASLLEFSDGSVMLVDTGSGGKMGGMDVGRSILAPYLWQIGIRQIDCVVITHPHEDHIGGLAYILSNFKIGTIVGNMPWKKNIAKNVKCLKVEKGDVIKGFSNADFWVFNPPQKLRGDLNEDSVVIKFLSKTGNCIFFCADAGGEATRDMLRFGSLLESDIVKIAHHGQKTGKEIVVDEFLKRLNCSIAVITNNNPERVNRNLIRSLHRGVKTYITGCTGAIIVEDTDRGFAIIERSSKRRRE